MNYSEARNAIENAYEKNKPEDEILNIIQSSIRSYSSDNSTETCEYAALCSELGTFYRGQGKWKECSEIYLQVLHILEHAEGIESPEYASALCNLASVYRLDHRSAEAEAVLQKAVRLYQMIGLTDTIQYASALNYLGMLHQDRSEWKESIELHLIALVVIRKLKDNEEFYAVSLCNLAGPYSHIGEKEKAVCYLKQAVSIYEKNKWEHNPHYYSCLNNLGALLFQNGEPEEAEQHLNKALIQMKEKYGADHFEYRRIKKNLDYMQERKTKR